MKSVVMLWESILSEVGLQHHVRTDRDLAYARLRLEHEGLSFLTITLPSFEKDLLDAISSGSIRSDHFCGFRRRGGLPTFLSGFLRGLFTPSGRLVDTPDARLIKGLRQILLFVSKISLPCTPERVSKAFDDYVSTDLAVGECLSPELLAAFRQEAWRIFGSLLSDTERRIWSGDWTPRHSSGAVANRASFNARYGNLTWTCRLHAVLPWWDELVPSYDWYNVDVEMLAAEAEPPVRVVTVPKTMKAPRIIAMEPVWTQYVQQGVLQCLTDGIKARPALNERMGWLDQSPNRDLSRRASLSGSHATVDLSEASDRVSYELAMALFAYCPYLRDVVDACRSRTSILPDGRVVLLNKFASMGSSLTFPVESMVFHTIVSLACRLSVDLCPDGPCQGCLSPETRVFGDDIIVPTHAAQTLMDLLSLFGLKVNTRKSFTTGKFRESCGADWYDGVDVSVIRMRQLLPSSRHHVGLLESAIDLQHRLVDACLGQTARVLREYVRNVFPEVPSQPSGTGVSAFWSEDPSFSGRGRFNTALFRMEYRSAIFIKKKPIDPLSDMGALQKFYSPHSERDVDHLERDGRSQCVGVTTGWVPESNLG